MSHYVECTPGFKDREALIEALVAVGFDRGQIEIHEEAIPLYGYQGDERPQRAHIVIRRSTSARPPMMSAGNDCRTAPTAPGSANTTAGTASTPRCRTASSRSTPTTPSPGSNAPSAARSNAARSRTARSRSSSAAIGRRSLMKLHYLTRRNEMRTKHVRMIIKPDGTCTVDAINFTDATCTQATQQILTRARRPRHRRRLKPEAQRLPPQANEKGGNAMTKLRITPDGRVLRPVDRPDSVQSAGDCSRSPC
jgi:hypothetical protein